MFGAAWFLRDVVSYWPAGTIFVIVVDPGVGTTRRILAASRDGKTLLAPDNGGLTFVAAAIYLTDDRPKVREVGKRSTHSGPYGPW